MKSVTQTIVITFTTTITTIIIIIITTTITTTIIIITTAIMPQIRGDDMPGAHLRSSGVMAR